MNYFYLAITVTGLVALVFFLSLVGVEMMMGMMQR
jgi:hypothetical protein